MRIDQGSPAAAHSSDDPAAVRWSGAPGCDPYDAGLVPSRDPLSSLRTSLGDAAASLRDGGGEGPEPTLERPPREEMGDFSSNAAMLLAGTLGEQPRAVAERLKSRLEEELGTGLDRVEVAGPGFVNLFLSDTWYRQAMADLAATGRPPVPTVGSPERVLVEF